MGNITTPTGIPYFCRGCGDGGLVVVVVLLLLLLAMMDDDRVDAA